MKIALLTHHRVKALKEGPYTQKDAEAAVGLRTDNGTRQVKNDAMEVEMDTAQVAT